MDAAGRDPAAELGELLRAGRLAEAETLCRTLLIAQPANLGLRINLANIIGDLGQADEAEALLRQILAERPDLVEVRYNLALLLHEERRLDEALAEYDQALAMRPDFVLAHNNRGAALRDLGRPAEALEAFGQAVALRGDYAEAQLNQAMCRLQLGDFVEGWRQYEWRRLTRQGRLEAPAAGVRAWTGQADLSGRTLLLRGEQGFGDTLQFCRFVPLVAQKGARVILEVQPGLERLLSRLDGAAEVVAAGRPHRGFDLWAPLMSLPLALGLTLETIPAETPYLSADPSLAAQWGRRMAGREGPRVGLVWAGAARADRTAAATDRRRSLPLRALAPLAGAAATFVSLQKGAAAAELRQAAAEGWAGPPILDWTAELADFEDTAALVANLDLVISCDTAVAHLAGALGKPVWVLNRFDSCWRWLTGRDDSPWYPTARLFRQTVRGEWDDVIERVAGALAGFGV